MQDKNLKRISLLIKEDQYEQLGSQGLNVSGLVRDLIDDYLSDFKITMGVSEETRELYNLIVANTGANDEDIEEYFRESLKSLLSNKIKQMQKIEQKLIKEK